MATVAQNDNIGKFFEHSEHNLLTPGPFDRSGLASLDDLSSPLWRSSFSHLESVLNEFLAVRPHCPGYPWPIDPLHNCIRVWEYPFVFHHLDLLGGTPEKAHLRDVVDLGSGATFFPFAVARMGCRVIAVDADPRAAVSLNRAARSISAGAGAVASLLSDARSISLESQSVDCVYCISVLEHIPEFARVISEVARILRPGGLFVLTFDVDMMGNWELGPSAYARLLDALECCFVPVHHEKTVHPLRVLTTSNSPYPMFPKESALDAITGPISHLLHCAYRKLRSRPLPARRLLASTYGTCLRKRESAIS